MLAMMSLRITVWTTSAVGALAQRVEPVRTAPCHRLPPRLRPPAPCGDRTGSRYAGFDRLVVGLPARDRDLAALPVGQFDKTPAVTSITVHRRAVVQVLDGGQCGTRCRARATRACGRQPTLRVPTGPTIVSGVSSNVITQRVVITSFRSVMWSLCRCVISTAVKVRRAETRLPPAASSTPRPASTR